MIAAVLALGLVQTLAVAPADRTPWDEFGAGVSSRQNARPARESFAKAAHGFDALWTANPSPALALARARSHFLAGNVPKSLAALHAGLALAPYDGELQNDLRAIRGTIRNPEPADPVLRVRSDEPSGLRARVSPWDAYLAAVLFGILTVVGGVKFLTARPPWAAAVALLGGVGIFACGVVAWKIDSHPRSVVILTTDAQLHRGNGVSYPPRLTESLPRGAEVSEIGRRGGWVQVELPGGAAGWVPESSVLK